eukprot:gene12081-5574_t
MDTRQVLLSQAFDPLSCFEYIQNSIENINKFTKEVSEIVSELCEEIEKESFKPYEKLDKLAKELEENNELKYYFQHLYGSTKQQKEKRGLEGEIRELEDEIREQRENQKKRFYDRDYHNTCINKLMEKQKNLNKIVILPPKIDIKDVDKFLIKWTRESEKVNKSQMTRIENPYYYLESPKSYRFSDWRSGSKLKKD